MTDHLANWKEELVACIHFLHQRGFAPATSSNYSFRLDPGGPITISSSGIDKGTFKVEDLMAVDEQGQALEDPRKPSAETLLHTLIYRHQPQVRCVLHTHSVFNTVLSSIFAEKGVLPLEGFEVLKGLEGIKTHASRVEVPIFANSQDIPALAVEIAEYWAEHPSMAGFLLAGHGLYTWGSSIAAAKRQIEVFEFLFECSYRIHMYSTTHTIL